MNPGRDDAKFNHVGEGLGDACFEDGVLISRFLSFHEVGCAPFAIGRGASGCSCNKETSSNATSVRTCILSTSSEEQMYS